MIIKQKQNNQNKQLRSLKFNFMCDANLKLTKIRRQSKI